MEAALTRRAGAAPRRAATPVPQDLEKTPNFDMKDFSINWNHPNTRGALGFTRPAMVECPPATVAWRLGRLLSGECRPPPPPPFRCAGHFMFAELVGYMLTRQSPHGGSAALFESVAAPGGAPWWLHSHAHGQKHGHGEGHGDGEGAAAGAGHGAAGEAGAHHHQAAAARGRYRWRFDYSKNNGVGSGAEGGGAARAGPVASSGAAPWLPPPMVHSNDAESHGQACFFGADLKLAVARMEGWEVFDDDEKPGLIARARGSVLEVNVGKVTRRIALSTLKCAPGGVGNGRRRQGGWMRFFPAPPAAIAASDFNPAPASTCASFARRSWRPQMGSAVLECIRGCTCDKHTIEGRWSRKESVMHTECVFTAPPRPARAVPPAR